MQKLKGLRQQQVQPQQSKTMITKIPFPQEDIPGKKARLDQGLTAFTTRTSTELGKYKKGQEWNSDMGRLKILDVKYYPSGSKHPQHDFLTEKQKDQIYKLGPFEVLEIKLANKSK